MKQEDVNKLGRKTLKNLQKNDKTVRTGWGPVSAILVTLGIYFGSQIAAGYLLIQYLFIGGTKKTAIASTIDNSVMLQFFFILFAELISLGLLWSFLRRRKIPLHKIGLKKPTGKNLSYALLAYAVYFVILLITFGVVKQFLPEIDTGQNQNIGFQSASGGAALSFVFVSLVILPALTEEILIRGFLYGGLRNKLPVLNAAIITSVIFGIAHLQLGDGSPVWIAAIDTFILSMVLIWLREKTGNIWAGVVVHMGKNALAFLSLFVFKII